MKKISRILLILISLSIFYCGSNQVEIEPISENNYTTNDNENNINEIVNDPVDNSHNNINEENINENVNDDISNNITNNKTDEIIENEIEKDFNDNKDNNSNINNDFKNEINNNEAGGKETNLETGTNDITDNEYSEVIENNINPLPDNLQNYFDYEIDEINFNTSQKYGNDQLKTIESSNIAITIPEDTVNISDDGDINILWEGNYKPTSFDEENDISVRLISIERYLDSVNIINGKISSEDRNYINSLFYSFLDTPAFKNELKIEWKNFSNKKLKENFTNKKIINNFVTSEYINNSENKMKYFVFTLFDPIKKKIIFLTMIVELEEDTYFEMLSDNYLETFIDNWLCLISSLKFI